MTFEKCPNCGTTIKDKMLKRNIILSKQRIDLINAFKKDKSEAYCNSCGDKAYEETTDHIREKRVELQDEIERNIDAIPVISTHSPFNWDYEIIGMVTGQSTTGTGVITEFTSSFTDLFGASSSRHNSKLKKGENLCFAQLRKDTLDLGGNAVIATDIDYAEVGSGKGILMVCMAGTAVKLKNITALAESQQSRIEKLIQTVNQLKKYNSFRIAAAY